MWSGSIRVVISHLHSNLRHQPFHSWTQNKCFRLTCLFPSPQLKRQTWWRQQVSKTMVLSATTLTLTMETKQASTRSEILKVPWTFKTSVPLYHSPWYNIPKDINQIAKTLVFGSTISTLFKEMEQFSQTLGFSSSLTQGIVQADKCALIHHKCFKSHMNYLPLSQKRYITYTYETSQQ
jgi:hypothetical protein